jgi:hypothetical protein
MEPVTLIVSAVALGAAAAAEEVVPQAIKDAYAGFKGLLVRKFGGAANVEDAVRKVEEKPESEERKAVLGEEVEAARSAIDPELIARAEDLLKQLQAAGRAPAGGGNSGNINTVTQIDARNSQGFINEASGPINQHFGQNVTHNYYGAGALSENVMAQWSPMAKNLYAILKDKWFSESELEDLAFQLDLDWDNLRGDTKADRARALVQACEQNGLIEKLRGLMRLARPNLRDRL